MGTMRARSSLREGILAALPETFHGTRPWYQRIDADVLAELDQIRSDWHAGKIPTGAKTLARTIAIRLRQDGIATIGEQGVLAWLKQKD